MSITRTLPDTKAHAIFLGWKSHLKNSLHAIIALAICSIVWGLLAAWYSRPYIHRFDSLAFQHLCLVTAFFSSTSLAALLICHRIESLLGLPADIPGNSKACALVRLLSPNNAFIAASPLSLLCFFVVKDSMYGIAYSYNYFVSIAMLCWLIAASFALLSSFFSGSARFTWRYMREELSLRSSPFAVFKHIVFTMLISLISGYILLLPPAVTNPYLDQTKPLFEVIASITDDFIYHPADFLYLLYPAVRSWTGGINHWVAGGS